MAQTIEVTGADRVRRSLEVKGSRMTQLSDVMARIAEFAQRQIRPGWNNQTGDLTASLTATRPEIYNNGFDLSSNVRYARFVVRGTVNMDARPPRVGVTVIGRRAVNAIARELSRP